MTRTLWGFLLLRILDALEQHGPMTSSEMCQHLGVPRTSAARVLTRLLRPSPRIPRRVHISAWRREVDGQRNYLRAVYAAGDGADARRPAVKSHRDSHREYAQRCAAKVAPIAPHLNQRQARALVAKINRASRETA